MSKIPATLLALLAATLSVATLAAPVGVSTDDQLALAPDVAVGPKGAVAVLWLAKGNPDSATAKAAAAERAASGHSHLSSMNLYVAVSKDGGASFTAPVRVNRADDEVWGFAVSRPRVAWGPGGTLHVAYPANEMQATLGKAVLTARYTRSTDGGATFEEPRRLSTVTDSDMSSVIHGGFASVAAFGTLGVAPNGDVHVLWIDTRDMKAGTDNGSIYGVVSHDDGVTFGKEARLAAGDVCPCCQINVAFDAASHPLLGSRQVTGGDLRSSTVGRADGAGHFTARVATGGKAWHLNGCPLKPTAIAVHGKHVYTAAHNGAETPPGVMFAASADGGQGFSTPYALHPGALVSDAPALAIAGDRVLVAWHAKTSGPRRVFYRVLAESGAALGEPIELAAGEGTTQAPALATRPDGRVQIAWQQGDRIYTTALDVR
ncbi:MAG: hypothetical protein AB7P31_12995 [Steroidobacteraceae bacterium]